MTDSEQGGELARVLAEIDRVATVDSFNDVLAKVSIHWPAIRAALERQAALETALREWRDERSILRGILESHAVSDGSREMLAQERIWKIELRLEALLVAPTVEEGSDRG